MELENNEVLPDFSLEMEFLAPKEKSKSSEKTRFPNLTEPELQKILAERHSARTKKATNWSVATFKGNYYCFFRLFMLMKNKKLLTDSVTKLLKRDNPRRKNFPSC